MSRKLIIVNNTVQIEWQNTRNETTNKTESHSKNY